MSYLHFRKAPEVENLKVKVNGKLSWIPILTHFFNVFDKAIQLNALIMIASVQWKNVMTMTTF